MHDHLASQGIRNDYLRCHNVFLTSAYEVRGKVMFVLGNVCLSISRGGGYPHPADHEGYPLPSQWGYPFPSWWREGVPHPSWWGTPISGQDGGMYPHPRSGRGVPPTGTAQHVLATRWAVCLLRSRRRTSCAYCSFNSIVLFYSSN